MGNKCNLGEVEYKGICVPSYFTDAEKEARYQSTIKSKSSNKKFGILLVAGIAILLAVFAFLAFNS